MPPGDYTVRMTSTTVRFGELLPLTMPGIPATQVTLAGQPVTVALPFPYTLNVAVLGSLTITTTLDAGQATVDPATLGRPADHPAPRHDRRLRLEAA
jgi:hypothetical protein